MSKNDEVREELVGAMARGYCTDRNSHKEMDSNLVEDMADCILSEFPILTQEVEGMDKQRLRKTICKIREGWEGAFRTGITIGDNVLCGSQLWTPVVWDDAEDPDFHKTAGLAVLIDGGWHVWDCSKGYILSSEGYILSREATK